MKGLRLLALFLSSTLFATGSLRECRSFGLELEWLYLQWTQENTWAYTDIEYHLSGENRQNISRKRFHPTWCSGARATAFYSLPCSLWELQLSYFYYMDRASRQKGRDTVELEPVTDRLLADGRLILLPYQVLGQALPLQDLTNYPTGGLITTAISSRFHLTIHQADLDARRLVCLGPNLHLEPFFGVRAAWINETLRSDYTYQLNLGSVNPVTQRLDNNSFGVGPHGGIGAFVCLCNSLQLGGEVGVSLLQTLFQTKLHNNVLASGTSPIQANALEEHSAMRFVTDLQVSLLWEFFQGCCSSSWVKLAWEHHLFINQNHLIETHSTIYPPFTAPDDPTDFQQNSTVSSSATGALGLMGVSVELGVAF